MFCFSRTTQDLSPAPPRTSSRRSWASSSAWAGSPRRSWSGATPRSSPPAGAAGSSCARRSPGPRATSGSRSPPGGPRTGGRGGADHRLPGDLVPAAPGVRGPRGPAGPARPLGRGGGLRPAAEAARRDRGRGPGRGAGLPPGAPRPPPRRLPPHRGPGLEGRVRPGGERRARCPRSSPAAGSGCGSPPRRSSSPSMGTRWPGTRGATLSPLHRASFLSLSGALGIWTRRSSRRSRWSCCRSRSETATRCQRSDTRIKAANTSFMAASPGRPRASGRPGRPGRGPGPPGPPRPGAWSGCWPSRGTGSGPEGSWGRPARWR